jgi:hypothetical protein
MAMLLLFPTIRVVYSLQRAKYTEIRTEQAVVGVSDHHLISLFFMFFFVSFAKEEEGFR